jgi:hypothetical protein
MIDKLIRDIQEIWDENFIMHMDEKAKKEFPKELNLIRQLYTQGKYTEIVRIADENYKWAFENADIRAELSPIGWNYMKMAREFQDLRDVIKRKIN